jgi:tRNA nucleotidyltransferase (CCA-adding enzyme)
MLPSFLALPPEELAFLHLIADEASARGLPAYIVGGFVRDLLLGHPGLDFDIVVVGDAVALAWALAGKHGGKVTTHPRFGTASWKPDNSIFDHWILDNRIPNIPYGHDVEYRISSIDLATARRETYARPGALPHVTPSTIEDDIRRRDFTINTLALRLDREHFGELVDLYNGAADIQQGIIRVLHDASFLDDPTRLFRAVRYEQRYGFVMAPGTLKLIPVARPLVAELSAERMRHELDLIFDEPRAAQMLARLDELDLLKAVSDVLPWSADLRVEAALDAVPAPEWGLGLPMAGVAFRRVLGYCLWLLDLAPAEIDVLQARLSFPLVVLTAVRAAVQLRADLPALSGAAKPSKWVERLDGVPLVAIYALSLVSWEDALETYAAYWRYIHPKTDGETLKALGVPPGPAYKKILLLLRAAWLDGEVTSDEQEKRLLEELLAI